MLLRLVEATGIVEQDGAIIAGRWRALTVAATAVTCELGAFVFFFSRQGRTACSRAEKALV
jgi:hypothetical protein